MQISAQPNIMAKTMAKTLRTALAGQGITVTHGTCLELVAQQLGFRDWNTLAAHEAAAGDPLLQARDWTVTSQTNRAVYRFGLDPARGGAAMLASRDGAEDPIPGEYAAYIQSVGAAAYRGQRLALRGEITTEGADAGTLWFRVDDRDGRILRFDNMMDRKTGGPLRGTVDWSAREIVLDIPEAASSLHYGFLLEGRGACWARGFSLGPVAEAVATTDRPSRTLDAPSNLGFTLTA